MGYCRYDDNTNYNNTDIDSEIIAIYVDCDKLGKGVGRKLVEYVMADLKNKNKNKMVIWCLEHQFGFTKTKNLNCIFIKVQLQIKYEIVKLEINKIITKKE